MDNNLKKYVASVTYPFGDAYNLYKLWQFNFKKEQTILIPVKYNHTCTKEINLMPSKRFSHFKIFLLKMKKIDNYGLNYHRYRVQPLVLRILRRSFWKY